MTPSWKEIISKNYSRVFEHLNILYWKKFFIYANKL